MIKTEQRATAQPPGASNPRPWALGTHRRWWWVAAAVVVLLLIAAGAVLILGSGSSADAAQVHLESVSQGGPSPFTAPVGQDIPNVTAPDNAGGQHPGNTGGLYAQNPDQPVCDNQALLGQLLADPTKAAAWVQPLGVSPDSIQQFVSGLNPVTLRSDTAVTEYGYADGQYQPYPAVLQAGTAVFINSYGEPTVKCYNGDPLGQPTASNDSVSYVGAPWSQFQDVQITQIVPTPAPIRVIVFVNPITNIQIRTSTTVITNINNIVVAPTPEPRTTRDGQLLLNGVRNYDGSIRLSDGRLLTPNGTIKALNVSYPPGSVTLPDGAIREPGGQVLNPDGTERRPISIGGVVVHPDGTTTPPLPAGTTVRWNYDGSLLASGPNSVQVFDRDGTAKSVNALPPGAQVNRDGSITQKDGTITNADGTKRTAQTLPDGTQLAANGSVTRPPGSGGDPQKQVQTQQGTQHPQQNGQQGQSTQPQVGQNQAGQNQVTQNQVGQNVPQGQVRQGQVGQNQVTQPQGGQNQVGQPQGGQNQGGQNQGGQNQVGQNQVGQNQVTQPQGGQPQGGQPQGGQNQVTQNVPRVQSQVPQNQVGQNQAGQNQAGQNQVGESTPRVQTVPTCTSQRQASGLCVLQKTSKGHH